MYNIGEGLSSVFSEKEDAHDCWLDWSSVQCSLFFLFITIDTKLDTKDESRVIAERIFRLFFSPPTILDWTPTAMMVSLNSTWMVAEISSRVLQISKNSFFIFFFSFRLK